MPVPHNIRFGFVVPEDLRRKARLKAIGEGTSLAAVMLRYLEEYVEASEDEQVSA